MGLLPLNYRRPALVRDNGQSSSTSSASSNNSGARTGSADSMTSGTSAGIPNALSFNRIMDGGTCPVSLGNHAVSSPTTSPLSNNRHSPVQFVTS